MVGTGIPYEMTARSLGVTTRTLKHWIRRWRLHGADGLHDEQRPGRPRRLTEAQIEEVCEVVRRPPREVEIDKERWTAAAVSGWIARRYSIKLGIRQCRRIMMRAEGKSNGEKY